jgi:hypothetical protein
MIRLRPGPNEAFGVLDYCCDCLRNLLSSEADREDFVGRSFGSPAVFGGSQELPYAISNAASLQLPSVSESDKMQELPRNASLIL